jgi:hypothetical protein
LNGKFEKLPGRQLVNGQALSLAAWVTTFFYVLILSFGSVIFFLLFIASPPTFLSTCIFGFNQRFVVYLFFKYVVSRHPSVSGSPFRFYQNLAPPGIIFTLSRIYIFFTVNSVVFFFSKPRHFLVVFIIGFPVKTLRQITLFCGIIQYTVVFAVLFAFLKHEDKIAPFQQQVQPRFSYD